MSSSAKRVQKLRQGQSEEERKAELARNAQWKRDKRAAAKNAKIKDPQQRDQKTPHESSSLSLGADDSGFATMNVLEATSISSQCATTMTPVRGSSFRGSRKGSKSTDGKSASPRIDGEDSGFVSMQAIEMPNNSLTNCKPLTFNCEINNCSKNNSQEINNSNNEVLFNYKDCASDKSDKNKKINVIAQSTPKTAKNRKSLMEFDISPINKTFSSITMLGSNDTISINGAEDQNHIENNPFEFTKYLKFDRLNILIENDDEWVNDDLLYAFLNVLQTQSNQDIIVLHPLYEFSGKTSNIAYQYMSFTQKKNLLKGSLFAQHDNRDSQFSCGDAANILNTLHVYHCSFFAQHDNRDSQFSCGDAANILYALHVFHYIDIQNVSYQLCFKRLRAYFSKSSNMLHVSKLK